MKKNRNKKRSSIILSTTIVVLIVALVSGGTYAWYKWVSSNEDDTELDISVGGMTMTLDGGGDINVTNLAPTICTSTEHVLHRTITYSVTNPTKMDSTATIQLNPSTFPTQLKTSKLMWKLTTEENCNGTEIASGNFGNTTQGRVMDLTNKLGVTKEDGITYYIPAETTTALTGTYYLSIWLDESYEGSVNVGFTVNDSIQDKSMTLKLTGTIVQNGQ